MGDFLKGEAIGTPEEEVDVRLVLAENAALRDENAELKERLAYLEKVTYGQKSEKTEIVLEGAEQESDIHPKTLQTTEVKARKRTKRTRDEVMVNLPVEEMFHEVEDKTCDQCDSEMTVIGKEKIRDELVYVSAVFSCAVM